MISSVFKLFLILFQLSKLVQSKQIAAYWGQSSSQEPLAYYCEQGNLDVAIIAFVNNFSGDLLSFNFGNACDSSSSCATIANDINKCQSLGVKVLLSIGGAVGDYGLTDTEASNFASLLFQNFGPEGTVFPGAQIYGFDLDIENGSTTGYTKLVTELKNKFAEASNAKHILVSASPQCVYPDAYLNDVLVNGDIDYAFIQFYNNYCNLNSENLFNWDTWLDAASKKFQNKEMQLFVGLPGSQDAASSGYATIDVVKEKTKDIIDELKFGGFMVWDANYAKQNDNYLGELKNILSDATDTASIESSSSSSITTSVAASSLSASLSVTISENQSVQTEIIGTAANLTTTAVVTEEISTAYTTTGGSTSTLSVLPSQPLSTLHTAFVAGGAETLTTTSIVYVNGISSSSSATQISGSTESIDNVSASRTTQTLQPSSGSKSLSFSTLIPTISSDAITKISSAATTPYTKGSSTTVYMATTTTTASTATDAAEVAMHINTTTSNDTKIVKTTSVASQYVTAVQELANGHVVAYVSV